MANVRHYTTLHTTQHYPAFTLLEVILALSLTGVVLMLLMTAIELFLINVDTSRTQVEAAQLARALLAQIADDVRAARYYAPTSKELSSDETSAETEADTNEEGAPAQQSLTVLGIYGTASELRIDRAAAWRWERLTREIDASYATTADEMPQTVRYFLSEGDPIDSDELAAEGIVEEDTRRDYSGLSCQRMATIVWTSQPESVTRSVAKEKPDEAELIAPEVVGIEFTYYDAENEELVDEWDSAEKGGLPIAVQITLELATGSRSPEKELEQLDNNEAQIDEDDTCEYKLFVRLPNVRPREKPPGPQSLPDDSSTEEPPE